MTMQQVSPTTIPLASAEEAIKTNMENEVAAAGLVAITVELLLA